MYLQNLKLEREDADLFKADILNTFENEEMPSESDIENSLADMYQQAADATAPAIYEGAKAAIASRTSNFKAVFAGRSIWRRLLSFLCRILNATSTAGDILAAILDFLIANIPGGILFKGIVKKILKYFMNRGYNAICPVV